MYLLIKLLTFTQLQFFFTFIAIIFNIINIIIIIYIYIFYYLFRNTMYDCKAPLSRFYYPDTRRIINAFIIIRKGAHLMFYICLPFSYTMKIDNAFMIQNIYFLV